MNVKKKLSLIIIFTSISLLISQNLTAQSVKLLFNASANFNELYKPLGEDRRARLHQVQRGFGFAIGLSAKKNLKENLEITSNFSLNYQKVFQNEFTPAFLFNNRDDKLVSDRINLISIEIPLGIEYYVFNKILFGYKIGVNHAINVKEKRKIFIDERFYKDEEIMYKPILENPTSFISSFEFGYRFKKNSLSNIKLQYQIYHSRKYALYHLKEGKLIRFAISIEHEI